MIGKHLLINIHNIIEHEKLNLLDKLINNIIMKCELKSNIINKNYHKFQDNDITNNLYILDNCHLSIYTYSLLHYCTIDLFTSKNINVDEIIDIINNFFNYNCWIKHILIDR